MSDWEVLGIAPTRDAGEIRKAYATRLKAIKRDLDPHAFQALREAYERTLAGCKDDAPRSAASVPALGESPPAPASPYGPQGPAPRIVLAQEAPEPRRERTRWRDLAVDAPDPADSRRQQPPDAPRRPDDRSRVDAALAAIREGLDASSPQAITDRFTAVHDALAHPVDGVSIAALAGFERAVIDLVAERIRSRGTGAAVLARAASERFAWPERMRDVRGDLDPLSGALAGFLEAEEIFRCAQGAGCERSAVGPDFARDLTGPLEQTLFAREILRRKSFEARREQWERLLALPGEPVAWLPPPNVEWWRRAFGEARHFPDEAIALFLIASFVVLPSAYLLVGVSRDWGIALTPLFLFLGSSFLYVAGVRQDSPHFAFLKPMTRFLARLDAWRKRTITLPGVVIRVDRQLLLPFVVGMVLGGLGEWQGTVPQLPELLTQAAAWMIWGYVFVSVYVAYRMADHFARRARDYLARLSWGPAAIVVGVLVAILYPLFQGIRAADQPRPALEAMGIGVLEALGALVALALGTWLWRSIRKLHPWARPWAWVGVALVIVPLVVFAMEARISTWAEAFDVWVIALVATAMVLVTMAAVAQPRDAYAALNAWVARIDSRWTLRMSPRLHAFGVRLRHAAVSLACGGLAAGIAALQQDVGLAMVLLVGGVFGGAVAAFFLYHQRESITD